MGHQPLHGTSGSAAGEQRATVRAVPGLCTPQPLSRPSSVQDSAPGHAPRGCGEAEAML